jgi:hypothetical protein
MGNYDLLSGLRMTPLLMASGSANHRKAVAAEDADHLV